jgi:hypothetical protein
MISIPTRYHHKIITTNQTPIPFVFDAFSWLIYIYWYIYIDLSCGGCVCWIICYALHINDNLIIPNTRTESIETFWIKNSKNNLVRNRLKSKLFLEFFVQNVSILSVLVFEIIRLSFMWTA